jgi:hypothetical protein
LIQESVTQAKHLLILFASTLVTNYLVFQGLKFKNNEDIGGR